MISFIKGNLIEVKTNSCIIECNSIGYEIFCPISDLAKLLPQISKEVLIYTNLVHKEDSMTLYGFLTEKIKEAFLLLLKVSGIGPKLAVKILSHYDVDTLFEYVEKEDVASLKSIPGIGLKMAQKIILDLKGVLPEFQDKEIISIEKDLLSAMINLGYNDLDVRNKIKLLKPLSENFDIEFKRLIRELSGKK